MKPELKQRLLKCIREMYPTTKKTCLWLIKMTVSVSFAIMLLKYFGVVQFLSQYIEPVFKYFGLPGASALAYVSGYFVNCYTGIAVMVSLDLNARAMTILGTMLLCSHSMIIETAVLKKTGASAVKVVLIRTCSAFLMGFILNLILPGEPTLTSSADLSGENIRFIDTLTAWILSTLKLCIMMVAIIFTLNFFQRCLTEFGWTEKISKFLSPVMAAMGLPKNTAFLWVVANLIGLSYGGAAMLDEIARGNINKREVNLLDSHICVNHSNLEDLSLFASIGGSWGIMLISRLILAIVIVWTERLFEVILARR